MSVKLKALVIFTAILVLIPAAVTVYLNIVDTKTIISSYFKEKTGRSLVIDGLLGMGIGFTPEFYAEDIRLSNSEWGESDHALTIGRLTVSLSLAGLFSGRVLIQKIVIDSPRLWIERNRNSGQYNIDIFTAGPHSGRGNPSARYFDVAEVEINHGKIHYLHDYRNWVFDLTRAKANADASDQPVEVNVSGGIQGVPIVVSGTVGSLESILERHESAIELVGYFAGKRNIFEISGVFSNMLSWKGLNLWCKAFLADLSAISNWTPVRLPAYRDIAATWELVQPGSAGTLRMESIRVSSSAHGLDSYMYGEVRQLTRFNGVDLRFKSRGNLDLDVIAQNLDKDLLPETVIEGTLSGDRDNLELNLARASLRAGGMEVSAAGSVSDLVHDWSRPIQVNIRIDDTVELGKYFGLELPAMGEVEITADIAKRDSRLHVADIAVKNNADDISLSASGAIDGLGENQTGMLAFKARGDGGFINSMMQSDAPIPVDNFELTGVIEMEGKRVTVSDLSVIGSGDGVKISGTSGMEAVDDLSALIMDVKADVAGLDRLSDLAGIALPRGEPLSASAELTRNAEGKLSFKNIAAKIQGESIRFDLAGDIEDFTGTPKANLDFSFYVNDIDQTLASHPDLPVREWVGPMFPVNGKGQIRYFGAGNKTPGNVLRNFVLNFDSGLAVNIEGKMDNLFTSRMNGRFIAAVDGDIKDGVFDSAPIHPVAGTALKGRLKGNIAFGIKDRGIAIHHLGLSLISENGEITAVGRIDKLSPFTAGDLALKVKADRLGDLIDLSASAINPDNDFMGEFNFNVIDDAQHIQFDVSSAKNDIRGNMQYSLSDIKDGRLFQDRITAVFKSSRIDLTKLLIDGEESGRIFSDDPLALAWLDNFHLLINGEIGRFKNKHLDLKGIQTDISVKDGRMAAKVNSIDKREFMALEFLLSSAYPGGYYYRLTADGKNVDLSSLSSLSNIDRNNGGRFSVKLNSKGFGHSVSEMAAHSDGVLLLELEGVKIKNQRLNFFGGDLVFGLLTAINPLAKENKEVDIECSVIHFDVEDGVASSERGIAFQTPKYTVLGGGRVDLSDESLQIVISTKARKGLGINPNTIAKLVRVGGTIAKPEIGADLGGLIQTGVAIGAAIASGGLSLIAQGLFDKTKANADVCGLAAEGVDISAVDIDAAEAVIK